MEQNNKLILREIVRQFILALILICILGCTGSLDSNNSQDYLVERSKDLDSLLIRKPYIRLKIKPECDKEYLYILEEIGITRKSIVIDSTSPDSLSLLFTDIMVNQIFPYWYGTQWDFDGYTSVPNQGKIACGYFVSTSLLHAGLNIDRYKFAQQLPINEAKTLAIKSEIIEINVEDANYNKCIKSIADTLKPGLFFIGFDYNHVGFLLNNNDRLYLIHSNYLTNKVMIEPINKSLVFQSYTKFYLVDLSNNYALIKSWINGSSLDVITKDI